MRLKYIILYVENVRKSMEFYKNAFDLKQKMIHESGDYGELLTGNTTLSFATRRLMKDLGKVTEISNPKKPVFEIAFETDDVAASLERAKNAGATVIQEIREEAWGQTTSYVADEDGYLIEICSAVKC